MKWARLDDRLLGGAMGGMHIGVEVGSVITRCGGMFAPRRRWRRCAHGVCGRCPPGSDVMWIFFSAEKKRNRTSRQTQVGIGHSAPEYRGGHVQDRSRRREQRRGRQRTKP